MAHERQPQRSPGSDDQETRPVALTARWIAAARANENARPNRLFEDPYAATLAGVDLHGAPFGRSLRAGATTVDDFIVQASRAFGSPFLAIRTRFFDELLLHAVREGEVRQVVLLAAGLDARAYRLPWPLGTHVFELDQPAVLAAKQEALDRVKAHPTAERHALGVDLAAPGWEQALLSAGYDPGLPSAWLVEGLLMYLDEEAVRTLLQTTAELASPGSWLGADLFNTVVLTSPLMRPMVAMVEAQGTPWRFATDDPVALFGRAGWAASVTDPGQAGAAYGRWPRLPNPPALPGVPRYFLVAARREAAGGSSGS